MLKQLRWLIAAALLALAPLAATPATLLPNGKQTFLDANGAPLAGGFVYFYIPGTSTPKTTWQDPGQTIPNSDPVVLDAGGRAIIYGAGAYQQLVQDSLGNLIWNQLTSDTSASGSSFGGTSTGSANSQLVAAGSFTSSDGQAITFIAGFTNTGAMTVTPSGGAPIAVLKDVLSGPTALTGHEAIAGNVVTVVYSQTTGFFHLVTYPFTPGFGAQVTVASAAATNLGAVIGNNIVISGSTTITSFGTGPIANPLYLVTFTGSPLLTNSAALLLPGGANIQAAPGSTLLAMVVPTGWQVISFNTANAVSSAVMPQGRLTLATGTPVMSSTLTAATSVIYTPYLGNQLPLWNGSSFSSVIFSETSQLLSDATLSPAPAVAASVYDEFAWASSGSVVVTRGPAWTNATTRGYSLSRVNGVLVNASAIANGPAAGFGTYLGTIATDAGAATVTWGIGGSASGGTAGQLNVWNMYNRVIASANSADTGTSYNYGTATIREARASTGNQINFVLGQTDDAVTGCYSALNISNAASTGQNSFGLGFDTITSYTTGYVTGRGVTGEQLWTSGSPCGVFAPAVGKHYISAVENADAGVTATFDSNSTNQLMVSGKF